MKIYVEKVLDEVVYFSTDYGKARGIWKGNNRPFNKVWEVSSHSEERDTDSPSKKDDVLFRVPFWLENEVHWARNDTVFAHYYEFDIVFNLINHCTDGENKGLFVQNI